MHPEALAWVARYATDMPLSVLDLGGRDINGTCRHLFPNADYTAVDIVDGPAVDVVVDAATWTPDRGYDLVVCCEVFEHTEVWPDICRTAYKALHLGGRLVVTCAGPGRAPHSGIDGGGHLHPGEHYRNVDPGLLAAVLDETGFTDVVVDVAGYDVRATAVKD